MFVCHYKAHLEGLNCERGATVVLLLLTRSEELLLMQNSKISNGLFAFRVKNKQSKTKTLSCVDNIDTLQLQICLFKNPVSPLPTL